MFYRQLKCDACQKRFGDSREKTFHLRNVHKIGEPVKCPHCGLGDPFKSRNGYYKHVRECKALVNGSKTAVGKKT